MSRGVLFTLRDGALHVERGVRFMSRGVCGNTIARDFACTCNIAPYVKIDKCMAVCCLVVIY